MGKRVDRSAIVRMLNNGDGARKIAAEVGCSLPEVYKVGKEIGHSFTDTREKLSKYHDDIVDALKSGVAVKCIATRYGVAAESVRKIRDNSGIERHLTNQYGDYEERLARAKAVIAERTPNFEYVGGFIDTDSFVELRCRACGAVKIASMITVRKGKIVCRECYREKRDAKQIELKLEKDKRRQSKVESKAKANILRKLKNKKQIRYDFCNCGAALPIGTRAKYCQDCRRRIDNKRHEMTRRLKLKSAWVDSDITVQRLYQRDGGTCWLCGGACDWKDYVEDNGTIICGDNYPSIDHVIPLSKGGKHSWSNVKLAHRLCNTVKGDRVCPPSEAI